MPVCETPNEANYKDETVDELIQRFETLAYDS